MAWFRIGNGIGTGMDQRYGELGIAFLCTEDNFEEK